MSGKVLGAEQAFFFAGDQDKEDRAPQFFRIFLEAGSHVEDEGAAGAVVHGSVVNAVAVDGFSDADVIEVGGEHHVFIFQSGIAAGQFGDEVGRLHFGDFNFRLGCERNSQRKVWQRLAIFAERGDFFESVARSGKEFLGAGGIDE